MQFSTVIASAKVTAGAAGLAGTLGSPAEDVRRFVLAIVVAEVVRNIFYTMMEGAGIECSETSIILTAFSICFISKIVVLRTGILIEKVGLRALATCLLAHLGAAALHNSYNIT